MEKFTNIKSIPAYLPIVNVDTDMIIPKQFLKTIKRTGLGVNLFFEMRYDKNSGEPIKEFVLNKDPFNKSKILIGEKNFGCGSSREHAPWALLDFGIRVIIAPSFADIFYNNCFKNGILPICLPDKMIKELSEYATNHKEIEINLDEQKITKGDNQPIEFEIDSFRKECLINGYDDIALTLKKNNHIEKFIEQYRSKNSWLF
jgi:3-isopropylmalate/(R)-2-methylmalate dehydratase small subunit